MKLAAIINSWDDYDLLVPCVENIRPLVEMVIVVISYKSNYGENRTGPDGSIHEFKPGVPVFFHQINPDLNKRPEENERNKRNFGLSIAKGLGATHFLNMDTDEYYEAEPFLKEKQRMANPNLNGLVCASQVYFKDPMLTIGLDTTLVTFIQKITPEVKFEWNPKMPFAFVDKKIRIDPTRQVNVNKGIEWSNIIMHHYSYVRKDLEKKIRNSTARYNLERSTIRQDFVSAKEGQFCKFYGKTLIRASVDFNIPYVVSEDNKSIGEPGTPANIERVDNT
jgi:hypothetical protein